MSDETVVLRAELRAGSEEEYARVHARIPADLAEQLAAAGVTSWRTWRDGRHLVHVLTVTDRERFAVRLGASPVNLAWQKVVGPLIDVAPRDMGLVWSLRDQLDAALD